MGEYQSIYAEVFSKYYDFMTARLEQVGHHFRLAVIRSGSMPSAESTSYKPTSEDQSDAGERFGDLSSTENRS